MSYDYAALAASGCCQPHGAGPGGYGPCLMSGYAAAPPGYAPALAVGAVSSTGAPLASCCPAAGGEPPGAVGVGAAAGLPAGYAAAYPGGYFGQYPGYPGYVPAAGYAAYPGYGVYSGYDYAAYAAQFGDLLDGSRRRRSAPALHWSHPPGPPGKPRGPRNRGGLMDRSDQNDRNRMGPMDRSDQNDRMPGRGGAARGGWHRDDESSGYKFADSRRSRDDRYGGFSSTVKVATPGIDGIISAFECLEPLRSQRSHERHKGQLYIAGLPPDTENTHLYRLFAPFGAIGLKGVHTMLAPDGKCKGIAFVNFLEEDAAQAAIATFHGAMLPDGSLMRVSMKMPREKPARNISAVDQDLPGASRALEALGPPEGTDG